MRRWALIVVLIALALPVSAQRWRGFVPPTAAYDGRFLLARLYYSFHPGWSFDWPDMEDNLRKILSAVTAIDPHPSGGDGNIFRMDDPELLKFPVAYLSEPGYWYPSEAEVLGLRRYLAKGGFLIVDDFHFADEWAVFEAAMRRVLPDAVIERLPLSHPVFHSFFEIKSLEVPYPGALGRRGLMGEFFGIHEEGAPSRRLMVVINYNMDIGDYMEHSARGFYPVDPTNEAFKFGVNYLIYGLSH
jgi:Domain of unknown function (DUF4159)